MIEHRAPSHILVAALLATLLAGCAGTAEQQPATATLPTSPAAQPSAPPAQTSAPAARPPAEVIAEGDVNLTHLNFLSELATVEGQPMLLTHIYSEAPNYDWVDASGEGIACVDDVARAAIVYLDYVAQTDDPNALARAKAALNFVAYMQADDGEFYNFVLDQGGAINQGGQTSYKSMGWWAFRGMWALARGYAVFKDRDPAYAAQLQESYLRTEGRLRDLTTNVGRTGTVHGFEVPGWLPGGAADASGVAVLALAEYQSAAPNDATAGLLTDLANALATYQLGGPGEYPFGMHPDTVNAPGFWHAWGSHQSQALARAGAVMGNQAWIDSAAREADTLFAWQLAGGFFKELGVVPVREGQIAYGTNTMVQAFMNLHAATGDARYARMGGLAASWFFGNNIAGAQMYDPASGRGYDGIDGTLKVNQNAGAESTIEALMAIQAVSRVPEAARYLRASPEQARRGWLLAEVENGQPSAGQPVYGRRGWTGEASFSGGRFYELKPDDAVSMPLSVPEAGDYWLYASHLRRAAPTAALQLEAPRLQPAIDGALDEWAAAPAQAVDRPDQILRGAQSWRGAESDSFALRLAWDEQALYIAADVRDPAHEQTGIGPGVGGQDALWIYLDTRGDGRRIGAKLTLAQTPDGPQVWDWKSGFALPKAELAWKQGEASYVYEAALPWDSLGARPPKPGQALRLEVGRGFGGDSFMDIGGRDPDSAENLIPLALVEQAGAGTAAAPATQAQPSAPEAVAFSLAIDGGAAARVPQRLSPDRDYLWLDRVGAEPLSLEAGEHTAELRYDGSDQDGSAVVDALLLIPAVSSQTFIQPDGTTFTIRYTFASGELAWEE